jgi:hypothetical protein
MRSREEALAAFAADWEWREYQAATA